MKGFDTSDLTGRNLAFWRGARTWRFDCSSFYDGVEREQEPEQEPRGNRKIFHNIA